MNSRFVSEKGSDNRSPSLEKLLSLTLVGALSDRVLYFGRVVLDGLLDVALLECYLFTNHLPWYHCAHPIRVSIVASSNLV